MTLIVFSEMIFLQSSWPFLPSYFFSSLFIGELYGQLLMQRIFPILSSSFRLAEDRVDYMERSPSISMLFHVRVISLALLLAVIDVNFIVHAYQSTLSKGASVQLVFGFEYAILLTIVANTLVKYILHSIDLYR